VDRKIDFRGQFTLGQQPHTIKCTTDNPGFNQSSQINCLFGIKLLGINRGLNSAQIDGIKMLARVILFHAAAGGVGLIACQWAKQIGATVIGTVGSPEKAELAKANGCDHTILYRDEDFVEKVKEITGGKGVDVVYDSLGKDTFEQSLDCLKKRGMMVSFGNATGPVAVPNLGILAAKGALYVCRPTLFTYIDTPEAFAENCEALFGMVESGKIDITIGQKFALKDAAKAHDALEGRATVGSTLLIP
ncbi:MAG: zinc-binding dehydrogenase, partial [Rhizobiaceae bacterium]|nr:zinc-binding dehydrogenase [Rhizobiaceae bacterium]